MKKRTLFICFAFVCLMFIPCFIAGCFPEKTTPINNESELIQHIQEGFKDSSYQDGFSDGKAVIKAVPYELTSDITVTSSSIKNRASILYDQYVPSEYTEEEFAEDWGFYRKKIVLDGKNHTIKNLSLGGFCASLFGSYGNQSSVTVKNITFDNLTVSGEGPVGAFLASNLDGCAINLENVHIINSTITSTGKFPVGGFIGYSNRSHGTIKNCTITNSTINGVSSEACGGLIGKYSVTVRDEMLVVSDCESKNNTISAKMNVGGIFGMYYQMGGDYGSDRLHEFKNLTNSSTIEATDKRAGGIIGHLNFWDYANYVFDNCKNEPNQDYSAKIQATNRDGGGILGSANWSDSWPRIPSGSQINFKNCTNNMIINAYDNAGGISGYLDNRFWLVQFNDCKNLSYGTINGINKLGGISGTIDGTILGGKQFKFTNCENNAFITGVGNYAGGIAAYNKGINPLFTNCKNTSQYAIITSYQYVGGISGYRGTFVDCSNDIPISHNGSAQTFWQYVGGIVGYGEDSTFTNCSNSGKIIGHEQNAGVTANYIGGIAGFTNKLLMTDCSNSGTVAGSECVGGLVGKSDAAFLDGQRNTLINCSNTGDVYAFGQESTTKENYDNKQVKGKVGLLIGSFYTGTLIFEFEKVTVSGNIYIINDTDYVGGWCGFMAEGSENTLKNAPKNSTISYKIYLSENVTNVCKTNFRYGKNIFEEDVGEFNHPTALETFTYAA